MKLIITDSYEESCKYVAQEIIDLVNQNSQRISVETDDPESRWACTEKYECQVYGHTSGAGIGLWRADRDQR